MPVTTTADPSATPTPDAPERGRRREVRGGLAGVLAGCMVVAALLVTGQVTRPLRFAEADATDQFIAAWKRSRESTFVVESEWKRVKDNGEELVSASLLVQEPPRRVFRQMGTVSADVDGKHVECFTSASGVYGCSDGRPIEQSFGEQLEQEMNDLRDHFYSTKPPIYRVRTDGHGCFELVQTRPYPNPTFGRLAQVCFDDDTGAMRYSERYFDGLREILRADRIRTHTFPSDFELSNRPEFQGRTAGGPVNDPNASIASVPAGTAPPPTSIGTTPGSQPGG